MNTVEQFPTGSFVEIHSTGKQGVAVGPSGEPGEVVVEHYPGVGSGHYRPEELKSIDKLRKVDWNHCFRLYVISLMYTSAYLC